MQSLNYCNLIGTPHFALTDGKSWKVYATFEQAPLADRVIATFSIGDMATAEVCLKVLALWRPSVIESKVSTGQIPIVGLEDVQHRTVAKHVEEEVVETPAQVSNDAQQPEVVPQLLPENSPMETGQKWTSLSNLNPQKGDKPPSEIEFPDSSRISIRYWNQVAIESTHWLIEEFDVDRKGLPH